MPPHLPVVSLHTSSFNTSSSAFAVSMLLCTLTILWLPVGSDEAP